MYRLVGILLVSALVGFGQGHQKSATHPDYVPDARTAERIAEAVLIGQFGEERVKAQLPLRAELHGKDWMVQGLPKVVEGPGGNFGVWVNRYDASVRVIEHMK